MTKKVLYISSLFCFCILLTGCSDWLEVDPVDKSMEEKQFSTEVGIQSVLTGLYKEMASNTLYGANLSQTVIEAMANRYLYLQTNISVHREANSIFRFSTFEYTESAAKSTIAGIWRSMYKLAFRTNNYLNALEKSSASLSKGNKELLLGEGYAIRAYLHFDLFRLFGPFYNSGNLDKECIPYNTLLPENDHFEADLIAYGNVTVREFFKQLLEDITKAESLLENNDLIVSDFSTAVTPTLSYGANKNYENRNRRLNYYAVRVLRARVLQYQGELDAAAAIAQEVLDASGFSWAETNYDNAYDYTLFNEVIFGLDNQNQRINATAFYENSTTGSDYFMTNLVYNTVFNLENDSRTKQWAKSAYVINSMSAGVPDYNAYFNRRYTNTATGTAATFTAGNYFQVLMRRSELLYMIAESHIEKGQFAPAVELLNTVLEARDVSVSYRLGGDNNPTLINDKESLYGFLRLEYYREFATEGQIYFFQKRHQLTDRLDGVLGTFIDLKMEPEKAYIFPIPTDETNL